MIGTRFLKIRLELAEIIKVKVGNRHLEIDILLLHRGRKIRNFDLNYLNYFYIHFQNFCAYRVENFLNFCN